MTTIKLLSARRTSLGSVFVDTASFEYSHGGAPRGRGWWGFGFGDPNDAFGERAYWAPYGTYGDAVRLAKSVARWLGRDYVEVLP